MDISGIRRQYKYAKLHRSDMPDDPLVMFEKWLGDAVKSDLPDPTAMIVSTVGEGRIPSQRTVLLKKYDHDGFVFFTNYGSRKAQQIAGNPHVSLLFPWYPLDRQVAVQGTATKTSYKEIVSYFLSRPKDSQIGAWVSHQSRFISARGILEAKFLELKQKFQNGQVPVPDFWGGFRVSIDTIEFWQGGENRLHDRFLYTKRPDGGFDIGRLAP